MWLNLFDIWLGNINLHIVIGFLFVKGVYWAEQVRLQMQREAELGLVTSDGQPAAQVLPK